MKTLQELSILHNIPMKKLQISYDKILLLTKNLYAEHHDEAYIVKRANISLDRALNRKPAPVKEKYKWLYMRKLYNAHNKLTQHSVILCPVCQVEYSVKYMHLHHLLPKSLGKHLIYDTNNTVYVCKDCHKKIHTYMGN